MSNRIAAVIANVHRVAEVVNDVNSAFTAYRNAAWLTVLRLTFEGYLMDKLIGRYSMLIQNNHPMIAGIGDQYFPMSRITPYAGRISE